MKIVSRGKVLNSPEFYKKKRRKRKIKIILLSLGLLIIVVSLVYFSRHERIQIAEITVSGETVVSEDAIVSTVEETLSGYYFWLIPRSNALVYPRGVVEQTLFKKFPRLKSINLNLDNFQKLYIAVEERVPDALYCTIFSTTDISECYFIDENGFIFAPAPSFSDGVYFVYTTRDLIENPLGKRFISPNDFELLTKFIKSLETLGIYSSALAIEADQYIIFLPNYAQIIWRKDANLLVIYANLEAFLSDDSIKAQENFLEKITYLDLRTENKVFYKFRD